MEDFDSLMEQLKGYLGNNPANLNILEDQVELEIQMEYFDLSKKVNTKLNIEKLKSQKDNLFNDELSVDDKKKLLCQLATLEDVAVYRSIEKFFKEAPEELHKWSALAYQQSKMVIQSSFLDESQVYISTGLGGKGTKLRYNVVFMSDTTKKLTAIQNKVIKNESELLFKQNNIELENITYFNKFISLIVLVPISVNLKTIFNNIITECNQFGGFLKDNFIITNVKILEEDEIKKAIKNNKKK